MVLKQKPEAFEVLPEGCLGNPSNGQDYLVD